MVLDGIDGAKRLRCRFLAFNMPARQLDIRRGTIEVVRLTIQRKVLLAAVVLSTTMVLILIAVIRWNLGQSFERYTVAAELFRLDWLIHNVESEYARHQGWEFIQKDPDRVWRSLSRPDGFMRRADEETGGWGPNFQRPPPPRPGPDLNPPEDDLGPPEEPKRDQPFPHAHRPPPPHDPLNVGPRLTLLDAGGEWLAGARAMGKISASRPILFHGEQVGTVSLRSSPQALKAIDAAFLASQTQSVLLAGGAVLFLSLLAGGLLIRQILAPIHDLMNGAKRIAEGRLESRIPIRTEDELGELSKSFNAMAERLERAETTRRQWVHDASHELRTPLAVLRAEIEALQDGVREPNASTYARLHQQVQQLAILIDDLRQTLDQTEGMGPMEQLLFQPVPILEEVLDHFTERFHRAQLRIERPASLELRPMMRGDAGRIMQVFSNLLENSLRYTDPGGLLKISVQDLGEELSLIFEDTPPAPSRQDLAHLFDRFFRSEPSRSRALGGSGLGLSICKNLVEAHGGRMTAGLSPLGGLAIRIVLPLEKR